MTTETIDSVFARRSEVARFLDEGLTDGRVCLSLLSGAKAVRDEAVMWDFKSTLPALPVAKPNEYLKKQYDIKISEIIKDCVAFHNTYGGYIIVGIDDKTRDIVEFSGEFDAADLNKRINGATGTSIETVYRVVTIGIAGKSYSFGLLFIPKRNLNQRPVQFKKNAPENENGKKAFSMNDFYMRERDSCRPATSAEDLEFIFGKRSQKHEGHKLSSLDHNLPPRDFDLVNLIGRENEIAQLWRWLPDSFSPIKILCGVGGVGKTSIAYTFAERLVYQSPGYLTKLIWLGAKETGYGPLSGRLFKLPRVDFSDIDNLLIELLLETGCPAGQIPEAPSREQLLSLAQSHLSEYPYLLVIDNVDSLDDEEQQQIFHLFTQLCSISKAKAVITARRNLGAARSVYVEVEGLSYDDFQSFVSEKCKFLRLPSIKPNSSDMKSLYEASGGSPLFALSVLRLSILGDSFADAIKNWKGFDGEVVRRAAFEREIGRLNANEAKTLLVLCYLGKSSASEVCKFAEISRYDVQNALETLQSFSMTIIDSSLPSGAIFEVPPTLSLVSSLVENRVQDWREVKRKCLAYLKLQQNQGPFVADTITKTMSLLRAGENNEALVAVATAIGALPDNEDLYCLMGRCYLAMGDSRAEDSYKKAFDLGCRKRELIDGWIEYRQAKSDWKGVIDIATVGEREHWAVRYVIARLDSEMMIADQLAKLGKYVEAETRYDHILESLTRSQRKIRSPNDQHAIGELKETMLVRWLGVVRMIASKQSSWFPRYFRACRKAIVVYHSNGDHVFRFSLEALSEWLDRVGNRENLSETAYEQLVETSGRLSEMISSVRSRKTLPDIAKRKFLTNAQRPGEKIEALIAQYKTSNGF